MRTGGSSRMSRATETASQEPYEAVADVVLRELLKVRRGRGLTVSAMEKDGPTIQELPAVHDQIDYSREQGTHEDRPTAAVNVIKCTVYREILHPDLRTILEWTLNFTGSKVKLTGREMDAGFAIGVTGKDSFRAVHDEAYRELQAQLLSLRKSPCRTGGGNISAADWLERIQREVLERMPKTVAITVPLHPLVEQILIHLANESNQSRYEVIVSALLSLLPKLESFVPSRPANDLIETMITGIARQRPDLFRPPDTTGIDGLNLARLLSDRSEPVPALVDTLLTGNRLREIFGYEIDRSIPSRDRSEIGLEVLKPVDEAEYRRRFWEARAASLRQLAHAIAALEEKDAWQHIFGQGSPVAVP